MSKESGRSGITSSSMQDAPQRRTSFETRLARESADAPQPGIAAALEGVDCSRIEILGINPWKRWQLDGFLRGRFGAIHYNRSAAGALRRQSRLGGCVGVWAAREPQDLAEAAARQGARLIRIEDGFLRSVGLGSNRVGGASLVLDAEGIYFDPRRPSRLERLLQDGSYDAELLARAAWLRQFLVRQGLTKYNLGAGQDFTVGGGGRRRLLVAGQVEDDASVRCGAPGVAGNLPLLEQVRAANPGAWIVYKPHPDTEAGTRLGGIDPEEALRFADQIASGVPAAALFEQIDEVHTMTSLLGFEALLRGLPVTTWGQPFYAGWGLTHDHEPPTRRTRRLSLEALIAGALILYPLYLDPVSGQPCEVEDLARRLASQAQAPIHAERSAWRRSARLLLGLYRSWRSARGRG